MKRSICLTLGLALVCSSAFAADLTDPLEILKKVDESTKAVHGAKYDISVETTGDFARMGSLNASVILLGNVSGAPEKYFIDAKINIPGIDEPARATAGSDNDMFYIIDHKGKVAYEDLDPAVMGRVGGVLQRAMTIEFIHNTPFSDEINGQSRELKGSETIGGEDCYIIHVVYASPQAPEATWSFSKKDFLPRRRINHLKRGEQSGTQVMTLTNVVADPKVDDSAFKLKLPKGYTKTDDFAPNFLPQPPAPPSE